MKLADLNISRCGRCGKIYKREQEKLYCLRCSEEISLGRRTAAPRPVAIYGAELPLETAEPSAAAEGEAPCVRCSTRGRVEGSDFCLNCTVELYSALGQAAENLFQSMEHVVSRKERPQNVMDAFLAKRNRAATHRINPVGAVKLKY